MLASDKVDAAAGERPARGVRSLGAAGPALEVAERPIYESTHPVLYTTSRDEACFDFSISVVAHNITMSLRFCPTSWLLEFFFFLVKLFESSP